MTSLDIDKNPQPTLPPWGHQENDLQNQDPRVSATEISGLEVAKASENFFRVETISLLHFSRTFVRKKKEHRSIFKIFA